MGNTLDSVGPKASAAEIVHKGERLILPEGMEINQAINLLERRQEYLQTETELHETFPVFPWDGAHALNEVLKDTYGWAPATATPGMFGDDPPKLINIEVGPDEVVQVPWGRFKLPNVRGFIQCTAQRREGRLLFSLVAHVLRKDEVTVQNLFNAVREYIASNSIYRGKAIKIRFRDDDGDPVPMPEPKFMDTRGVDRSSLIFAEDVQAAVETNLFTPIERVPDCQANGIEIKRGVLLAGTYGVGKSMAAKVAAAIAVQAGLTFLYVTRADELAEAVEFAKLYQSPACVIFCEDIDRTMAGERSVEMDDVLNVIDGIDTKTTNILTVLTTNKLEAINPAMLRPGRLDAVIEVTPPDAKAVEKLIRYYGGEAIDPEADLGPVGKELAGTIPAVIAEVVKRAKLAQLRRQEPGQPVEVITKEALLESAKTMKAQTALLSDRQPKGEPSLDEVLGKTVRNALNGVGEDLSHVRMRADAIYEHVS